MSSRMTDGRWSGRAALMWKRSTGFWSGEKTLQEGHSPTIPVILLASPVSSLFFSHINFYSIQSQRQTHLHTSKVYMSHPFLRLQPIPQNTLKLSSPFQSLFDTIVGNIYLGMNMKTKMLQLSPQSGVFPNAIPITAPLCNAASIEGNSTVSERVLAPHSAFTASLPLIKSPCQ